METSLIDVEKEKKLQRRREYQRAYYAQMTNEQKTRMLLRKKEAYQKKRLQISDQTLCMDNLESNEIVTRLSPDIGETSMLLSNNTLLASTAIQNQDSQTSYSKFISETHEPQSQESYHISYEEIPSKKKLKTSDISVNKSTVGECSGSNENQNKVKAINYNFISSQHIPDESFQLSTSSSCTHCGAKIFASEPKGFCCLDGQISLVANSVPTELRELFLSSNEDAVEFRKYVRTYNNNFAFTSFGVKYDKNLSQRNRGIYTFKAQGQIYHYINALLPHDSSPAYLQLYFYDTEHEVENRLSRSSKFATSTITKLIGILNANPYALFFRQFQHMTLTESRNIIIRSSPQLDQRLYNTPTVSQVAAVWIEDDHSSEYSERDILIHSHSGTSHNVKHYFGCYDPLQYPLLFSYGDIGWHQNIKKVDRKKKGCPTTSLTAQVSLPFTSVEELLQRETECATITKKNSVSCREYYCYKLQIRETPSSILLHSGRLLQQYVVDMYIKLETSRLDFIRNGQQRIRADLYQGITDSIAIRETKGSKVGRRIILPSSFIGGPRDMRCRYLDAMALVHRFGKPNIFLTITCNPGWLEIKNELLPQEEVQNRPDLIARIFRGKIEELKRDLFKRYLFGHISAYVYVIEFQKRGLPHAHFLIILSLGSKITSPDMFDTFVCAELPDYRNHPYLHTLVVKHMMHGPCGHLNPNNVCMSKKGYCKNHYPRDFSAYTTQGSDSYPIYRRRETGEHVKVRNAMLDNRWVVPYNPYLLAKFNCHINVEICSTIKAVKYLYKYIYNGHDRIAFDIQHDVDSTFDEIRQFQTARWVSPQEAMWRIYKFLMNQMYPAVSSLQLHLPNKQFVTFQDHQNLLDIVGNERASKSMLTEYFAMNQIDTEARKYLYREFPEYYVWHKDQRYWSRRHYKDTIGRIIVANPTEGERYYLRLLLNHIRGPRSFEDLLTVNGVTYSSFRISAQQQGLLECDNSISECLSEASLFQMPSSLRRLFATILVYCEPNNVRRLWSDHYDAMSEDYAKFESLNPETILSETLRNLNFFLESMGKNIKDYDLPSIIDNVIPGEKRFREIDEELAIAISVDDMQIISTLNEEQRNAYNIITKRVLNRQSGAFFVDGPGGTGKTYLCKALLAEIRSKNFIAIATATSGVAASIMPGGRTAHSRFKIPINVDESIVCNISKQSGLAELLRRAKLIIWDEASMAKRQAIEALDKSLQDIMNCLLPFGGKVIIFGGDFRQILPVTTHGSREETINSSLVMPPLWPKLEKLKLQQNMRAKNDASFSQFLLKVGNGDEEYMKEDKICVPNEMVISDYDDTTSRFKLIASIFPDLQNNAGSSDFMTSRAILTPKNEYVDEINQILINLYPGDPVKYYSYDSGIDDNHQSQPEEFLNNLTPNGLPPHELILKMNCPIILLRNIDSSSGLCNGTRLVCRNFKSNVIDAEIAVGQHSGKRVFLPRIPLCPSDNKNFPFMFKRKQFPIRLCFAMTINKAQGQTLDNVGIYLPQPVFSHGQLYVALSRAKLRSCVKILVNSNPEERKENVFTRNVVYQELLSISNS